MGRYAKRRDADAAPRVPGLDLSDREQPDFDRVAVKNRA